MSYEYEYDLCIGEREDGIYCPVFLSGVYGAQRARGLLHFLVWLREDVESFLCLSKG